MPKISQYCWNMRKSMLCINPIWSFFRIWQWICTYVGAGWMAVYAMMIQMLRHSWSWTQQLLPKFYGFPIYFSPTVRSQFFTRHIIPIWAWELGQMGTLWCLPGKDTLWIPDLLFTNSKVSVLHKTFHPDMDVRVQADGDVMMSSREGYIVESMLEISAQLNISVLYVIRHHNFNAKVIKILIPARYRPKSVTWLPLCCAVILVGTDNRIILWNGGQCFKYLL